MRYPFDVKKIADRLRANPTGPQRDVMLEAAAALDDYAERLGRDEPSSPAPPMTSSEAEAAATAQPPEKAGLQTPAYLTKNHEAPGTAPQRGNVTTTGDLNPAQYDAEKQKAQDAADNISDERAKTPEQRKREAEMAATHKRENPDKPVDNRGKVNTTASLRKPNG